MPAFYPIRRERQARSCRRLAWRKRGREPGDGLGDSALLRFAGTGAQGYADGDPLTEAKVYNPGNITVGDDAAYVTERWGNRVRRIGR